VALGAALLSVVPRRDPRDRTRPRECSANDPALEHPREARTPITARPASSLDG
jgi:hypothetical protein